MGRARGTFRTGEGVPWWAAPWPCDATWDRAFAGFWPHPVVRRFVPLAQEYGPSPSGCAYFTFDAPPGAVTAEIVDCDDGRRIPAETRMLGAGSRYFPDHVAAVSPVPGFVMREGVAHAVLLRADAAEPDPAMAALLAGAGPAPWRAAFAPLLSCGVPTSGVVAATVFTPADQVRPGLDAAAAAMGHADAADFSGPLLARPGPRGTGMVEGRWRAPQFRTGRARRVLSGGAPAAAPTEDEEVPFGLVLPPGPPPERGWPLLLSIHGGGCRYRDRLPEICGAAAPAGIAVAAQTLPYNPGRVHGGRTYGDIAYFNVFNPQAAVGLFFQAVVEQMLFLRLLTRAGAQQRWPLDPERMYVIGHSNGGTTAGVLLAVEPMLRGGVVAGFGGNIGAYVEDSEVIAGGMDPLWPALTGRRARAEPRSRFHPVVNLAHTAWGVWDTANMAPRWILRPSAGVPPRHVYLAQGMHDEYASVRNSTAVICAAGLDVAEPPAPTPEAAHAHQVRRMRGRAHVDLPVRDNVESSAGGLRTGVAVEAVSLASGHEVCFEHREVLDQWVGAIASHARGDGWVVR
ncbi:MAG: hypothetical protein U0U69_04645 [Acidimicrobiia bacterium]